MRHALMRRATHADTFLVCVLAHSHLLSRTLSTRFSHSHPLSRTLSTRVAHSCPFALSTITPALSRSFRTNARSRAHYTPHPISCTLRALQRHPQTCCLSWGSCVLAHSRLLSRALFTVFTRSGLLYRTLFAFLRKLTRALSPILLPSLNSCTLRALQPLPQTYCLLWGS